MGVIDLDNSFDSFTLDGQVRIAQESTEWSNLNRYPQACQPFECGQPDALVGVHHQVQEGITAGCCAKTAQDLREVETDEPIVAARIGEQIRQYRCCGHLFEQS